MDKIEFGTMLKVSSIFDRIQPVCLAACACAVSAVRSPVLTREHTDPHRNGVQHVPGQSLPQVHLGRYVSPLNRTLQRTWHQALQQASHAPSCCAVRTGACEKAACYAAQRASSKRVRGSGGTVGRTGHMRAKVPPRISLGNPRAAAFRVWRRCALPGLRARAALLRACCGS